MSSCAMYDESHHSPIDRPLPESSSPTRPTWATVIGIIAIVVASLGLASYGLCAPAGTGVSYLLAARFEKLAEQQPQVAPQAAQLRATVDSAPLSLANSCVLAMLGVLLLVGAIGLLRMRPWARRALLWWAALRIILLVPSSIIGWIVQTETSRAMEEAARSAGGASPGGGFYVIFSSPAWALATVIFGALFALALPVFTLVWFNRMSIREQIRSWPAD